MKKLYPLLLIIILTILSSPSWAMDYTWTTAKGQQQHLHQFQGKPTLLHFWASWCPPCKKEMPHIIQWSQQHPHIQFIPISLDANLAKAIHYIQTNNLNIPALHGDQAKSMALGVRGLPSSLLIDANGKLLRHDIGAQPWEDINYTAKIIQLLQPISTNIDHE